MSFLNRFSKKDPQMIEILQTEFDNLRKKSESEFIGLVGMSGNIKGLDIISSIDPNTKFDVKKIKGFYAKLVETYLRISDLIMNPTNVSSLKYILFEYGGILKYCIIRIPGNNQFIIITLTKNVQKIVKGMDKLLVLLKKLEESRNEDNSSD